MIVIYEGERKYKQREREKDREREREPWYMVERERDARDIWEGERKNKQREREKRETEMEKEKHVEKNSWGTEIDKL